MMNKIVNDFETNHRPSTTKKSASPMRTPRTTRKSVSKSPLPQQYSSIPQFCKSPIGKHQPGSINFNYIQQVQITNEASVSPQTYRSNQALKQMAKQQVDLIRQEESLKRCQLQYKELSERYHELSSRTHREKIQLNSHYQQLIEKFDHQDELIAGQRDEIKRMKQETLRKQQEQQVYTEQSTQELERLQLENRRLQEIIAHRTNSADNSRISASMIQSLQSEIADLTLINKQLTQAQRLATDSLSHREMQFKQMDAQLKQIDISCRTIVEELIANRMAKLDTFKEDISDIDLNLGIIKATLFKKLNQDILHTLQQFSDNSIVAQYVLQLDEALKHLKSKKIVQHREMIDKGVQVANMVQHVQTPYMSTKSDESEQFQQLRSSMDLMMEQTRQKDRELKELMLERERFVRQLGQVEILTSLKDQFELTIRNQQISIQDLQNQVASSSTDVNKLREQNSNLLQLIHQKELIEQKTANDSKSFLQTIGSLLGTPSDQAAIIQTIQSNMNKQKQAKEVIRPIQVPQTTSSAQQIRELETNLQLQTDQLRITKRNLEEEQQSLMVLNSEISEIYRMITNRRGSTLGVQSSEQLKTIRNAILQHLNKSPSKQDNQKQTDSLQQQLANKDQEINNLKLTMLQQQSQHQEALQSLQQLQTQSNLKSLVDTTSVKDQQALSQELNTKIANLNTQNQSLTIKLQAAEKQIANLSTQLQSERKENKQQIKELEDQIAKSALAEAESAVSEQQRINEISIKCRKLESEAQSKDGQIQQMERNLQSLNSQLANYKQQIQLMQKDQAVVAQTSKDLEIRNHSLQEELASLNQQIVMKSKESEQNEMMMTSARRTSFLNMARDEEQELEESRRLQNSVMSDSREEHLKILEIEEELKQTIYENQSLTEQNLNLKKIITQLQDQRRNSDIYKQQEDKVTHFREKNDFLEKMESQTRLIESLHGEIKALQKAFTFKELMMLYYKREWRKELQTAKLLQLQGGFVSSPDSSPSIHQKTLLLKQHKQFQEEKLQLEEENQFMSKKVEALEKMIAAMEEQQKQDNRQLASLKDELRIKNQSLEMLSPTKKKK